MATVPFRNAPSRKAVWRTLLVGLTWSPLGWTPLGCGTQTAGLRSDSTPPLRVSRQEVKLQALDSVRRLPPISVAKPTSDLTYPVQAAQHSAPSPEVASDAILDSTSTDLFPRSLGDLSPYSEPPSESSDTTVRFDLPQLLATVASDNPQVGFAGERYREAYARYEASKVIWLPSIRAGVSYNKHEGSLQGSNGIVSDNSRTALNAGLGVQAIGAGSPIVPGVVASFHFRDAIFQPKIANHRALATSEAARTLTNDLLLSTALAHLEVLRSRQLLAIAEETHANAERLAKTTKDFADAGEGLRADAARAQTELAIRRNEIERAREAVELSKARLRELLSLDPQLNLDVAESAIVPLELVPLDSEPGALVAVGLATRPELAEARQLVCEAVHRYEREKFAPLLPSVLLGVSYSGFGGSDRGDIANYRDRFDLDGVAFWELRNLGLGERAAREESHARYQQERLREIQLLDQVAREILQAHSQVRLRHRQIAIAEQAIAVAQESYQQNLERTHAGQGLPLESLQSLQALDIARREYLRTVAEYDEAQFRLHRALGWPIEP